MNNMTFRKFVDCIMLALCLSWVMAIPAGAGTKYVWTPAAADNWSTAAAWEPDGVPVVGDTANLGTSAYACSSKTNNRVSSLIGPTGYTGLFYISGNDTCDNLCSLNTGGAITITGTHTQLNDANYYFACTGAVSHSSSTTRLQGTGTFSPVKIGILGKYIVANSGKTTTLGSTWARVRSALSPGLIINGGTFNTGSYNWTVERTASGQYLQQVAGSVISGTGIVIITTGAIAALDTLTGLSVPNNSLVFATVSTASGNIQIVDSVICTNISFQLTGGAANRMNFNYGSARVNAKNCIIGAGNINDTLALNMGTGTHTYTRLGSQVTALDSGVTTINWNTASIYDSGSVAFTTKPTHTAGTHTMVLCKSSGIDTIANYLAYGIQKTGASNTVVTTNLTANTLTTTNGNLKGMPATYWTIAGNTVLAGSGTDDTLTSPDSIVASGDFSTTGYNLLTNTNAVYWHLKKDGVTAGINAMVLPAFKCDGTIKLNGGGEIAQLLMPAAGGDSIVVQAATKIKINTVTNTDFFGPDASHKTYLRCATLGQRDSIDLPGRDTLENFYIQGQVFAFDTVKCLRSDSCVSGGYNNGL